MRKRLTLIFISWIAPFLLAQQNISFPSSSNVVNVTAYGAIPNDGMDDTAAIQQAITANIGQNTSLKTLYLPNGTYNLSDTLHWLDSDGHYSAYLSLQGESESGVVLRLADSTFTNTGAPQAVLFTASNDGGGAPDPDGEGNTAFSNYIQNLTIDTGSGNPGAIGIDYLGNNAGAIRNVSILSGDGDGVAGIYLGRDWPGPWMLRDVTIDGFNYALDFDQQQNYSTTADGLTIRNQQIAGIRNNKHVLSIRNLQSDNSVPVLINGGHEALTSILDANLSGGDITESAISYRGSLYLRNISISGYQAQPIYSFERSVDEGSSFIDEYISHPVTSQFPSPARSMQLPIEEIPATPDEPHFDWVVVGGFSDTNIQAAIDQANATGKKTVFLPAGQYNLRQPITISGSVERIYGFGAYLNWYPVDGAGNTVFTIENTTAPALFFEHVTLSDPQVNNFKWIQDDSTTPIVFRDIFLIGTGEFYANSITDGSKKIFIENCAIARATFTGAKVWAWQLDPEDKTYKIINDGSQMWIFGYKCEWANTNLINQNGARTEIIGGFFYPPFGSNSTHSRIGIINNESELTAIFTYSGEYNEVLVRDIRGGITQDYTRTQSTADGHPRFGNTVPLYSSWEATIPNAPGNLSALANGSHAIDLSWSDNAGSEIGFQLERRSGNENWNLVSNAIPVNSTSYTDTTVASETSYEYRLRALGNPVNSNLSNIASAITPSAVSPPSAPSALTATAHSESILLTWTDNSNNEDRFQVLRRIGSALSWDQIAEVGIDQTHFSDYNIVEGNSYHYRVTANNSAGNNSSSEASAPFALQAPSALAVTAQSSHLQLNWEDNSQAESGYIIERQQGGGAWNITGQTPANRSHYIDFDALDGIRYTYRVKAISNAGESSYSANASGAWQEISATFYGERFVSFEGDSFDLVGTSLTFRYHGGSKYDTYIDKSIAAFPVDYTGHAVLPLDDYLNNFSPPEPYAIYNNYEKIDLSSGKTFPFDGVDYSSFYVINDGVIHFGPNPQLISSTQGVDFSSLNSFGEDRGIFKILRGIAAQAGLFSPSTDGSGGIYYGAQLSDRYVVTWVGVKGLWTNGPMTCQTEMFFNGDIRITWLANTDHFILVGLSAGTGKPVDFVESDFSQLKNEPEFTFAVKTASIVDDRTIDVVFSEEPAVTGVGSATSTANYSLDKGVTVSSVILQADQRTARLTTSPLPEDIEVTATIANITNLAGNTLDTAFRRVTYDTGPKQYTLISYGTINGTIQLDPSLSDYTEGSTVTVTAVPAAGFMLERWSLDLNGNTNPISMLMDADKVIEASFVPDRTVPDVFENFEYASILTNQNGGDGWSGNWYNITGNDWKTDIAGLVHQNAIAPSGSAAYRQGGKAGRLLAAARGNNDGSILYLSFLMKSAGLNSSGIYSAINLLNGGDSDSFRQFEIGNLDDSGQFLAGDRSRNKTTQFGAIDTDTHQVVMEFTFTPGTNNDVIKLWMDPSAYTDAHETINGLDITFDRIVFNSWNQDITFDELRMAGNWEAVTRATPPVPPALLGEDLLAYALGAESPTSLPAAMPNLQTASGQPFTYQIADSSAEDVFYQIEISPDLSQWFRIARKPKYGIWSKDSASPYPSLPGITVTPSGEGVTVTHDMSADKYFLRLNVQ